MAVGALSVAVFAESHARIVHISFLAQPVEVSQAGAEGARRWTPAQFNAPVIEGESLRTGGQGQLEVQLECGSALRLAPDSSLTFTRLFRRDNGVAATAVALHQGRFFLSLRRGDTRDLHIQLPGAQVELPPANARFQIRLDGPDAGSIQVMSGQVDLHMASGVYPVKKSAGLSWAPGGSVEPLPAPPASTDRWARWSHDRDQAFDRALMDARPRSGLAGADVHTLPSLAPPAGSRAAPAPVWSILSAGADAALPDPDAPGNTESAVIPACAR